jgi:hypothetical protein
MCHQKKSDRASLQSEMACLDCLITKTGPKWVRKGLMDLSTMFHGCTQLIENRKLCSRFRRITELGLIRCTR